jgi:hypothetical protein
MVDMLPSCCELLGGNGGPPLDGVGKAKGHSSHNLTELIFAEVDEGLCQTR